MEWLIVLGLLAALGVAAAWFLQPSFRTVAQPTADEAALERQRAAIAAATAERARRERARQERLNTLAKQAQLALLTLDQAPDFQRAHCWARHAAEVPLAFRQRIFARLRSRLVDHMAARLAAGEDRQRLVRSLTELLRALGIAPFEAQYIFSEAQAQVAAGTDADRSFEAQLRSLRQGHERRMQALRGLSGVEADAKEQLLETEQTRFREAVLQLGHSASLD